jgi:Ca2+-binding EF-hand superfamily protein
MIEEAPGPLNFTMLLTLFGERLNGTDEEQTIVNAFKIFDNDGKGNINRDQ